MQRVAIVGSGGAGKSTLARRLGKTTGLPVIHLDEHFWAPGWVPTPDGVWRSRQGELLGGPTWIADGNYGQTLDVRFARADTIIDLELPRLTCTRRAIARSLRNMGQAIQSPGCPEHINPSFWWWVWRFPIHSRPPLEAAIAQHAEHVTVVRLRSDAQIDEFLASIRG
jgi:adenylate kinase family enzyme